MGIVETAAVCTFVIRLQTKKFERQMKQNRVQSSYTSKILKGKFYTLYENLRPFLFFRMNLSSSDVIKSITWTSFNLR